MTDLPAWLQEIRDRADKATEGPWRKCSDWMAIDPNIAWHYVESAATGEVITGNYAYEDGGVRSKPEDAEFIIGARMDVPRLVELVGEMAEKLEGAVTVLDDIAAYGYDISKVPNIVKEAILGRQALAKYHGEAEPTTPNESYWWCESCGCEVDGTRVTYEELHDVCGHPVEWREGDDER